MSLRYGAVWYGAVWYVSAIWYGVVWCSVVSAIWYGVVYGVIQCGVVSAIWYGVVWCGAVTRGVVCVCGVRPAGTGPPDTRYSSETRRRAVSPTVSDSRAPASWPLFVAAPAAENDARTVWHRTCERPATETAQG